MVGISEMAGHGGTVSKRTANKKLPNCTDYQKSDHQNAWLYLHCQKKYRGTTKIMSGALHQMCAPTYKFVLVPLDGCVTLQIPADIVVTLWR